MKTEIEKRLLVPIVLLVIAGALILLPLPSEIRLVGVVLLLFFLPGWSLLEAFFPAPTGLAERIVLASGISYAFSLLGMLYLIYLPGKVSQIQLLLAVSIWTILLLGMAFARRNKLLMLEMGDRRTWLWLLAVVGLALALRLPLMGYSEFHEDEIEVTNFAVDVLGGEEYALFLHRKGPVQSLLPMLVWLNTNQITEFISRFPFFLASVLSVAAVFLLAKRWAGLSAAVIAGLLLVVNGASIGFGRMVQYQSVILFLGPLAVWSFWYADCKKMYSWAIVGALLLAVCTLAHFDTFLYFPVAVWQVWLIVKNAYSKSAALKWLAVAGGVYALVVASFYIPYVYDPQFAHTLAYLTEDRIGNDFLYNNLAKFQEFSATYNSIYYLPLLLVASAIPLVTRAKSIALRAGLVLCVGAVASTFWLLDFWKIGSVNLAVLPWLVILILGGISLKSQNSSLQLAWIWSLTAFCGYVFGVDEPGTHYYVVYPAWVILAGIGVWQFGRWMADRWPRWRIGVFAGFIAAVISVLFLYQTILFWHTDSGYRYRYVEAWSANPLHYLYPTLPDSYGYFGAPRRLGWKVAGALFDTNALSGDYRSKDEIFSVPIWYTYRTPRSCYDDPQNYFVAENESHPSSLLENYTRAGTVLVEDVPRITLYTKGKTELPTTEFDFADYASRFDAEATIDHFLQLPVLAYPGEWYFGETIKFLGFDISRASLSPGETLEVTLRWQALEPLDIRYRAFVHLEKEQMWGQHDDDPACRLPITLWRTGQVAEGQFRVTIDPATPAGEYPLTIGIYNPDDWARMPVTDAQRNPMGDQLLLTKINVILPQ